MSIGTVARKTGLPVKVIRHWSDLGVVPPAGRTTAGYRCYDAAAVARLQLARTLRDLGMGLGGIRAALDREDGLAEVAAAHVEALEAQIRRLRTHQAVLRTVTHRTTRGRARSHDPCRPHVT
ncbi:MerR family transcriptional regulator [Streptomyces sp. NPDC053560]|uniref:helix-turn-helix domain-containing protein n=1 Tax=Streptomyces sp. NPDC053560 TaxID=3365711 RepID=UPI0037D80DD5